MDEPLEEILRAIATSTGMSFEALMADYRDGVGLFTGRMRMTDYAETLQIPEPELPEGFGNSALPDLSTVVHTPIIRGTNLLNRLNYSDISALPVSKRSGGDQQLADIMRQQGFDAKPIATNQAGIDTVLAHRGRELFRAFHDQSAADDFRYGPLRPATGNIRGQDLNGFWATTSRDGATQYTANPNSIVRMALRPDARTVHIATLQKDHHAPWMNALETRLFQAPISQQPDLLKQQEILTDLGKYTAARGDYDAIFVPTREEPPQQHWVILNRSAVVAQQ